MRLVVRWASETVPRACGRSIDTSGRHVDLLDLLDKERAIAEVAFFDGDMTLSADDGVRRLPDHPAAQLWLIDLSAEPAPGTWQACSPAEHERAARFRFALHGRRYRAAHAAMRVILSRELGIAASALQWREGSHGKPHLDLDTHRDAPQGLPSSSSSTSSPWHFNLSHSGDWALLGLSQRAPIGVDIECCEPIPDVQDLAQHHFTALEQQAVAQQATTPLQEAMFYRIWSRKEACLKALGSGLSIAPQCFEAGTLADAQHTAIPLDTGICRMTVCSVALPVNAMAAVAVLAPDDAPLAW